MSDQRAGDGKASDATGAAAGIQATASLSAGTPAAGRARGTSHVQAIQNRDTDDKSLQKYKAKLLGKVESAFPKDPRRIIVKEFVVEIRKGDDGKIDRHILDPNDKALKTKPLCIPEGFLYRFGVGFYAQHDICHGLKFKNTVSATMAKHVEDYTLGSYSPQKQMHRWMSRQWEEAPRGFLARGKYSGSCVFYDLDGVSHLSWNYILNIVKATTK